MRRGTINNAHEVLTVWDYPSFLFCLRLSLQDRLEHRIPSTVSRYATRIFQTTADGVHFDFRRGDWIDEDICAKSVDDVREFKLVPVSVIVRASSQVSGSTGGVSVPPW